MAKAFDEAETFFRNENAFHWFRFLRLTDEIMK